ncbi:MAG TPA: DUF992 domain-containing protein [Rhizomicrobium sp.]|jgi:hypothetical protein|nr:DUF992 domain-containing protein [Rhizomicrobium sp.]
MGYAWKAGVCAVAIAALSIADAQAARRPQLKCASPPEVAAIQTTVVDQQLVDAALTCGDATRNGFNSYRTSFGGELRGTDALLLKMFKRIYGGPKGDAAYNLFKTDMASKAELRRIKDAGGFCKSVDLVLAAANGTPKPTLKDFVAGVQVADAETPVNSCAVSVDVSLKGVEAAPLVVPKPRPPQPDDPPEVADAAPPPAAPSPAGIKVGSLTCNVSSGFGFIFGSTKELKCTYAPNGGAGEHYSGTFSKYGVDIGYADSAVLIWGVVAPTSDVRPGSLEGDYAGATAGATFGIGLGANVLIGGLDKSIALQPLSVQGNTGLNIAAGVGVISLKYTP